MKSLRYVILIIFLFSVKPVLGQDQGVWMYGWRPASTQEAYDNYMERLYVTKPYLQQDYERDVFRLYSQLQNYEELSVYCQGKAKDYNKKRVLNVEVAYSAWKETNKEYVELVNVFWNNFTTPLDADGKLKLLEKIEKENKESILSLEHYHDVSVPCGKIFDTFAVEDSKGEIIARESEQKRFSDAYRNIDFFLHPEKKDTFKKELKKQLDAGLAGEKACKKSGGEWMPTGMAQHMACVKKYPDAGKSCTDSSQCKGGCIDQTPSNHHGEPIGKCRADDGRFGCFSYLIKGKRGEAVLCID